MVTKEWPEVSKKSDQGNVGVVWVANFRAKMGKWKQVEDAINAVSAVLQEIEGDNRGYWWKIIGGASDEPNFMVVSAFENFAALDSDERSGVWKTLKDAKGEETMIELHSGFYDYIEDAWSYLYRHIDDMSYEPKN